MKQRKKPFIIENNLVLELIGQEYVCVAVGIEKPEIVRYPSDGELIVVKTEDGTELFYYDQARHRTVKAQDVDHLCDDTFGEIAYIDDEGERQRLAKLTTRQLGEDLDENPFPET